MNILEFIKKEYRNLLKKSITIKPESFFLFAALFFGVLTVFITPPLQAPDEDSHFLAVHKFSSLRSDSYFSAQIIDFVKMHQYLSFKPEQKYSLDKFKEALNHESYGEKTNSDENKYYYYIRPNVAPWYLPCITGMYLNRLFSENFCFSIWAGRLFNLITFSFALFYAIKISPCFKWGFVLLGLMPMNLFLAASLSYDSFTTAISYMIIALMLKLFTCKQKLTFKNNWLVIFIIFIMGFSKFPYSLIATPLLFIRKSKFEGNYYYILKTLVAFVLLFQIGIQVIPSVLKKAPAPPNKTEMQNYDRSFGSENPLADQQPKNIKKTIAEPGIFVHEFFNTLTNRKKILLYIGSFAGCLGWLDTLLPPSVIIFFYLILIFASLTAIRRMKLDGFERSIFFITGAGLFIAIHFIFYIFTQENLTYIDGIQGRYFIPFAPCVLLPFLGIVKLTKIRKKRLFMNLLLCGSILFVQIVSMTTLLQRYYFSYWWERNL